MPDYNLNLNEIRIFDNLEFVAKQVVEGFITGLHKSPFHGFSVEFAEHRQYNTGEPVRHVDWKLFARTDKLFVKRYEEETNLRCRIILDHSSSMFFPLQKEYTLAQPNKLIFSVYAAAALVQILKNQRDAFGLSVFSDKVELHTSCRSTMMHQKLMYNELTKILQPIAPENKKKSLVIDALHQIAEQIHRRSLVILFSDMFDSGGDINEILSALQHLKYNKHEVILFHCYDKLLELDFLYENRWYKFKDLESDSEIKLHTQEIQKLYQQRIGDYFKELKIKCGQYAIEFVEVDINQGFTQILLPYILKRRKMF